MTDEMEKYAVDESVDQETLEKRASHACPKCGGKVTLHGQVVLCKNCGSEPWENPSE